VEAAGRHPAPLGARRPVCGGPVFPRHLCCVCLAVVPVWLLRLFGLFVCLLRFFLCLFVCLLRFFVCLLARGYFAWLLCLFVGSGSFSIQRSFYQGLDVNVYPLPPDVYPLPPGTLHALGGGGAIVSLAATGW
jgi:hypothetical protein